jgi:hypothetical protein
MHSVLRYFKTAWVSASALASFGAFLWLACYSKFSAQESACISCLAAFTLFGSVSAYQLVRQSPLLIFSPMPWFLLASSVYFGFGPLIYFFGNDMAKTYCNAVWPVDLAELWSVTLLNALGVVLVFGVWLWQTREMPRGRFKPAGNGALASAILIFYLVGLPFRFITILSDAGLLPFTPPGFLGWLANLTSAGLVLLTAMAMRKGGGWWFLWGAMLVMDVIGGVLAFSKMSILLAVTPCIFGYLLYRPKWQALWCIPVLLATVYLASNSFVSFVRENVLDHNSILGRMEMVHSYFEAEEESGLEEDGQAWWTRLNYANSQVFAMEDYENGTPGDSLMMALIAPIPRILWPDKPIIVSGYEFYRRLTGRDTASFGIGFFAEAYWNGGWLAVILCSGAIGWIFGKITLFIGKEQAIGNLWVLPIALLWVRGGARVDGWIHTEIVGPGVFTLILIVLMRYWISAPAGQSKKRRLQRPVRAIASSRAS